MKIDKLLVALLMATIHHLAAAEGIIGIGIEKARGNGLAVRTVEAWTTLGKGYEGYLYADSTRYGEVLVGKSFELGPIATVLYAGVEQAPGVRAKARGALWLGYTFTESVNGEGLFEFGGSTGRYHKVQLHFKDGEWKYTLVHRSDVKFGARIGFNVAKNTWLYVQAHRDLTMIGMIYEF